MLATYSGPLDHPAPTSRRLAYCQRERQCRRRWLNWCTKKSTPAHCHATPPQSCGPVQEAATRVWSATGRFCPLKPSSNLCTTMVALGFGSISVVMVCGKPSGVVLRYSAPSRDKKRNESRRGERHQVSKGLTHLEVGRTVDPDEFLIASLSAQRIVDFCMRWRSSASRLLTG
jgi:hypothetical protein